MAAKSKGVGEGSVNYLLTTFVGDVIEITIGVGIVQVESRGNPIISDRHYRGHGFNTARTAEDDPEAQGLNQQDLRQPSAPRGPLNNLDRLVNWSHEFLNRNQDARIYPVPRDQGMPEGVVIEVGNQGVAYEHARGGRVSNL